MLALLSDFPGLNGQEIYFEELGEDSGIAFTANNGVLILSETTDILGGIVQNCQYPIFIVYRTNSTREYQKLQIQSFFDKLGRWITQQPVEINGGNYRLNTFPALDGKRKITRITRMNSYGLEPYANGVQDWLMPVTVEYTNEIDP